MKKVSITMVILFSLLSCYVGILFTAINMNNGFKKEYPQTMTVVQVDIATDTVTCEDATGNLWQFKGVEDWQVNDIVSMIMNDNGTEEVFDDEIVKVRYNGFRSDG